MALKALTVLEVTGIQSMHIATSVAVVATSVAVVCSGLSQRLPYIVHLMLALGFLNVRSILFHDLH